MHTDACFSNEKDYSERKDLVAQMNNDDKDINRTDSPETEDDVLINELFNAKKDAVSMAPRADVERPERPRNGARKQQAAAQGKPARSDARYTMTPAEIDTLAAAAEDAVADGRYGAALDSVFFTAGDARAALRDKINIRIPIGSSDTDLPIISAAALIESYLEFENINGGDIIEKLRLIIESSEDEHGIHPTAAQVSLRVFECVLILCVQAEQCGKHAEIKAALYDSDESFLCKYLDANIDEILRAHRNEVRNFAGSVRLQSRVVSEILDAYISSGKYAMPLPMRIFAELKPVMITSIVCGVLALISCIIYVITYGSLMSFIATDNFIMLMIVILEVLFCAGMCGVAWLVYAAGEGLNK